MSTHFSRLLDWLHWIVALAEIEHRVKPVVLEDADLRLTRLSIRYGKRKLLEELVKNYVLIRAYTREKK